MCLAVVALDAHPVYATVIVANRDEFHARAALPAHWWSEGFLAGRDVPGGGTWLGVTRAGRWGFLTNVRESAWRDPDAPSRGALVTDVLTAVDPPMRTLAAIAAEAGAFNGFNLLAGHGGEAGWYSNRSPAPLPLVGGLHGISNAALDTPWPKVVGTRAAVAAWCAAGTQDTEALFVALTVKAIAPDDVLPMTGVTLEWERRLSAPFIVSADYGTRCSTVLLLGRDGEAQFEERAFDPAGELVNVARERFTMVR
ncbi:MAG: NRDE family protein [Casimicrobiaceae bacterium]